MFLTLCIELHDFDWLSCGWGSINHGPKLIRALASDRWMGAVGAGVPRMSNLLAEEVLVWEVVGGLTVFAFCLGFLGLAVVHGLFVFWDRRSFSLAVPYISSLAGHLLASAGWFCSTLLFPRQFMHLMSWGQWPSVVVSMESPNSWAWEHLWHLDGLVYW